MVFNQMKHLIKITNIFNQMWHGLLPYLFTSYLIHLFT
jgi:hypothetical protein